MLLGEHATLPEVVRMVAAVVPAVLVQSMLATPFHACAVERTDVIVSRCQPVTSVSKDGFESTFVATTGPPTSRRLVALTRPPRLPLTRSRLQTAARCLRLSW